MTDLPFARRAPSAAGLRRREALLLGLCAAAAPLLAPVRALAAPFPAHAPFPDPGRRDVTLEGTLRGRNEARIRFDAAAGERLRIDLTAPRGVDARFNIWAPATRRAMWIGARSRTPYNFDGILEKSGTHEVQLFLAGAAARGDVDNPMSLRIRLTGGVS